MYLHRSLHCVLAFALVMGMSALTNSATPAATTTPAATKIEHPLSHLAADEAMLATSPRLRREVFGFALASSLGDPTYGYPSWNFSLLSTVAFFGLHINWDGTIVSDSGMNVWNSSTLTGLISDAHGKGTRVVLTIVLQDFQAGTPNMCAGLINRAVTVRQVVAQVVAKGADGLNVDYEGLNGTCQNGQTSQAMMTDFVRQLRAALPSGSYLSVDTYAGSAADPYGFFDILGLNAYVDSFFVMAYDLEYSNYRYAPPGCAGFCLGPTAPLAGYHYNDTTTARQYASVVSASKVILGVPYYGRKACVGGGVPNAYPASSLAADSYLDASGESTAPGVSSFVAHRDANDPGGHERWDTWFNSSIGCTRELYWDDVTSLGAKYDLVNADNLRGVGIWTLNYGGGAPALWAAISSHFVACAAVQLGASPAAQAPVGTKLVINAIASGCPDPSPLYEFWIMSPGTTTWKLAQAYSTTASLTWNTAAAAAGAYRVAVWVRDSRSTGIFGNGLGRWDASAWIAYTLYAVPCTAVSISVTPTPTSSAGAVTATARATGCPQPLYQFWILAPGATSWQMVQAYSALADWQWNSTGAVAGTYGFAVWARDSSSTGLSGTSLGRLDASSSTHYTVPCSTVTLVASPTSATQVGRSVTVAARASGCLSPLYQFWILKPGASSWQIAQPYSTTATFRWNTNGASVGAYSIGVWARDANSIGSHVTSVGRLDTFATTGYALTSSACSSVTLASAPASSTTAGTTVTITANASGCPNPLYQFWILAPGATSWQMVRPYSAAPTMQWSTTGAPKGKYGVAVWVRDANSGGLYGNSLGRWDVDSVGNYTLN